MSCAVGRCFLNRLKRLCVRKEFYVSKQEKCLTTHCGKNKIEEDVTQARLKPVGQPTYITHPKIIKKGELTPNLTVEEFCNRRQRLAESLVKCSPESDTHIIVIPASHKKYMTEKIPYVFRQDSDFFYLSGCLEPESILLLLVHGSNYDTILFLRGKDPQAELWDGPRTGVEQAPSMFGVDRSLPIQDFSAYINSLIRTQKNIMVWYDYLGDVNANVCYQIKNSLPPNKTCQSPRSIIHQLRLYKSSAEQELMRRTCAVGSEAIVRTIQSSSPGCSEAQLFARVDYECRMLGAQYLAYPPVVAGGVRANTIHYINNNQTIEGGELVLMDAGCELHGYTSDITRTWPISGKYSKEQRALYDLLHQVQTQLLKEVTERPTLTQLFHSMCNHLGKGLLEIGVVSLRSSSEKDLSRMAYEFCPHHVGHYLGLDVHDTPSISRSIALEPGMVITVEPGIYISPNNTIANPLYRGIGMRIEDDVLITETGPEVLTASCPKHPEAIESILTSRQV